MAAVLLDTQVLIQAYLGEKLPKKVQAQLADPQTVRFVSAASLVEIAIKNSRGRINMGAAEFAKATRDLALTLIAFAPEHALRMFRLPTHHSDPFDRMIIATAIVENMPLMGGDRQFRLYEGLRVIW